MLDFLGEKEEERKVEYIELIYDLIFVHTIGRCGDLLNLEHGIPDPMVYLIFMVFSVAVLEAWYFYTIFINRFPQYPKQRNVSIFVSMYLLYYVAAGINDNWRDNYRQIHVGWALILLHLAVQYAIALRKDEEKQSVMNRDIFVFVAEPIIILASIPIYERTGFIISPFAIVLGIAVGVTGPKVETRYADFPHLTERLMLYVVFSFGEMIIEISGFFDEGIINLMGIVHSLLAFALVSGLFLNYGYVYDHIIDREKKTTADGYLFIHMFLIISLSYLTQVMEMLRNPDVDENAKIISLGIWLVAYVIFLSLLERYAKVRACWNYYNRLIQISLGYIFLLHMTRWYPVMNFSVSVAYVYLIHLSLRIFRERKLAPKVMKAAESGETSETAETVETVKALETAQAAQSE